MALPVAVQDAGSRRPGTSGHRNRLAAGGGADLHDFAVAEDRKMNRLARRVAQLLDEGPGNADQVHISGIGAAEFEQSRPQRIGAGFRGSARGNGGAPASEASDAQCLH